MKKLIHLVLLLLPISLLAQVTITNTNNYYTIDQMLLANEINESGEPFAEAIGYNLDDLDPMVPNSPDTIAYTLGIENYEYSRYQLGTVVSQSGIGLHIMWSPIITQSAALETDPNYDGSFTGGNPNGFNEDDKMMQTIMGFGARANQTPPANAWPQFAEFVGGDPHLPQPVAMNFPSDFSTLRWDRGMMDKTLNPGAMGQTMVKQYLWAQDMLGGFHDGNEEDVDPNTATPDVVGGNTFDPNNDVFYGGNNLDGFVGMVLTAEAINKMMFFRTQLAYDGTSLGGVDPATYNPADGIKFFPHAISVTESQVHPMLPPKMETLTVTDASSHLFDQTSLMWGTLNFKNMMDPDNTDDSHLTYHSVFDGDPFPPAASISGMPGPFDLMKGMSKVIFLNTMTMHFNATEGTFVDVSNLVGGAPVMGTQISAIEAGYILPILTEFVGEFAGTPLEGMAMDAVNAQANFILNKFSDGNNGYFNSFTIGTGADSNPKLAVTQAAIARGLYAAYNLTGNAVYLTGADAAYNALITNFYVPSKQAFRTEDNNTLATYTPFNVAVITGALREARLVGNHMEAPAIFTRFFQTVGDKMQLSEAAPSGETGNDSDGDGIPFIPEQADQLPPIFAAEATLDLNTTSVNNIEFANDLKLQTYPNPLSDHTTISFELNENADINIEVFNLNGQLVETLLDGSLSEGKHTVEWQANKYAQGIYYYKLTSGNKFFTEKVILVK